MIKEQGPLFKMFIIGDGGVGKTSFVRNHIPIQTNKAYFSNQPPRIALKTNKGDFRIEIRDTAGQEKLYAVRQSFYKDADMGILMFDVTSRMSYKNLNRWYKEIRGVCQNIPIALVCNKVDQKIRKIKANQVNFHKLHDLPLIYVSVKAHLHIGRVYQQLLRRVLEEDQLVLTQELKMLPSWIKLQQQHVRGLEEEWREADKCEVIQREDQQF